MRRPRLEGLHGPPYLEDLIVEANPLVNALVDFDLRRSSVFTSRATVALDQLWEIFENLSYQGRARGVSRAE